MQEYTVSLAKFVAGLSFDKLPPEVISKAKYTLLDYLGVTIGGSSADSSKPVQELAQQFGSGEATVLGTAHTAQAVWAALANGVAAHSLELDDTDYGAMLHVSSTVMSTALALAESFNISGKDLLVAAIAGSEVALRIAKAGVQSCDERGFHPTGICNVFGAAAAASRLLNASAEQTLYALGIAAHQAGGIQEFLVGHSWTKRLHPGWSAHAGIVAAMLGKKDFLAERSALEGKKGFLNAYYNSFDLNLLTEGLNKNFEFLENNIKPYACCGRIHTSIDAFLRIVQKQHIKAQDVVSIQVAINSRDVEILNYPEEIKINPPSATEAQFSIPYTIAAALLYGDVSIKQFAPEIIASPAMHKYMKLVRVVSEKAYDSNHDIWPARVTVTTQDNKTYTEEVFNALGSRKNPMSWEQLVNKFKSVGGLAMEEKALDKIPPYVKSIEQQPNMQKFSQLLRGK